MKYTNYTLILTDDCNLRCTYCFDDIYSDRTCNMKFMTIDMLPDLFFFIEKTRDKERDVIFNMFGGEPTLNWKFFKAFCEYARTYCHFPHSIITTTNGTLLTSDKIDFFKRHNVGVSVSLDGTPEANKERITKDGKTSWEKVIHSLPELTAKIPNVNVLMTVSKHNLNLIVESYKMLLEIGATPLINFDRHVEYTKEELDIIKKELDHLFVENKLPFTGQMYRSTIPDWLCNGTVCAPADRSVSISPDGKLYFCHQFVPKMAVSPEDDTSYGDIKNGITNDELFDMFVKRSYFNEFSKDKDNIKCGSCPVVSTCKGGCMAEQWHRTKSFTKVNKTVCEISMIIDDILQRSK